jgi:hypothetical protein
VGVREAGLPGWVGLGRANAKEWFTEFDRFSAFGKDFGDGAGEFGFDFVHDLHGLDDADDRFGVDDRTNIDVGGGIGGWGGIKGADHGGVDGGEENGCGGGCGGGRNLWGLGLGDGVEGGGGWVGGGKDLGFPVRTTANTDFGAVFFVLELGEAIFAHQIDDRLNLFNIHRRAILREETGINQKENTLSLK